MAPRASWKGFVQLSLVSVPVKAYTATASGAEIHLNQLHAECNSRIQYKKTCPIHGDVPADEIVSGYEFAKGQYVVIDPEEVSKLRRESDKAVGIEGFLPAGTIDPVYHSGKTYYLLPDGPVGQKPYALMIDALREQKLEGVARAILSGKEQVVLLRPIEGILAMTVLEYQSKVKSPATFLDEVVRPAISKEEVALTRTLIDASRIAEFDFGRYTDEYVAKLTQLIEAKVAGQEIVAVPQAEEPKVINLMEALKASVAKAQSSRPAPAAAAAAATRSTKKMAPSGGRAAAAKSKKKSG